VFKASKAQPERKAFKVKAVLAPGLHGLSAQQQQVAQHQELSATTQQLFQTSLKSS
jgi:hypothetical protein